MPKNPGRPKKAKTKNAKIAKRAKTPNIAEVAKIVETEIVRFLETFEIWVFLERAIGFSKKLEFHSKSLKVAILLKNAFKLVFFLNISSTFKMRFFAKKIRNFWKSEKLITMMKQECFLEEKTFSSFQKLFLQRWEGAKYADGS